MERVPRTTERCYTAADYHYTNILDALMRQVFLSYAEADALDARHLHLTLRRSRDVEVWGYKEDGRVGADFKEEFEDRIHSAHYFCLLDGPHARQSSWIRHECSVARASNAIMVICVLAKHTGTDDWSHQELFPGQNLIRAVDLTHWDAGVQELCQFLQIVHSPGWGVPRDLDFEREVFDARLEVGRTQELVNLYRDFRERSHDTDFAENLLRVVISKSQLYGAVTVVSPRMALGVMQADAGRHEEALQTFADLTTSHASDPRGWAGLAGAHFHGGRYTECLRCLHKARELASTLYREEAADRLPELAHNIASVQLILGFLDEADCTIRTLPVDKQRLPAIRALCGKLLLRAGRYEEAMADLEAAWSVRLEASAPLAIDLADCYRALGRRTLEDKVLDEAIEQFPRVPELHKRAADCHLTNGRTSAAVDAMRRAGEHSPSHKSESPEYRAQLAALLCKVGRLEEGRAEARRCIEQAALTKRDRYYRGLAYYLVGQPSAAAYELTESRRDPVVKDWPDYRTLLNG